MNYDTARCGVSTIIPCMISLPRISASASFDQLHRDSFITEARCIALVAFSILPSVAGDLAHSLLHLPDGMVPSIRNVHIGPVRGDATRGVETRQCTSLVKRSNRSCSGKRRDHSCGYDNLPDGMVPGIRNVQIGPVRGDAIGVVEVPRCSGERRYHSCLYDDLPDSMVIAVRNVQISTIRGDAIR